MSVCLISVFTVYSACVCLVSVVCACVCVEVVLALGQQLKISPERTPYGAMTRLISCWKWSDRGRALWEEEIKQSLFVDNIVYIDYSEESTKNAS